MPPRGIGGRDEAGVREETERMGEHTHDEIVAAVLEGCCPDCHARLAVTGACPNGDGYWSAAADDTESSYRYMPADGQYAGGSGKHPDAA